MAAFQSERAGAQRTAPSQGSAPAAETSVLTLWGSRGLAAGAVIGGLQQLGRYFCRDRNV
jgi:hypothetical protein